MPLSWQYWEYSFNLLICHTLNMTTSSALSKFFQYSHVSRMTASPARSRSSRTPVCAWSMHVIEACHRNASLIPLRNLFQYSHVLDMATDLGVSFFQYLHVSHIWLGLDDTCRIQVSSRPSSCVCVTRLSTSIAPVSAWHDSFICAMSLMHVVNMPRSCATPHSYVWLIHMCDSCVWHMTTSSARSYSCRTPVCVCVTWLMHMRTWPRSESRRSPAFSAFLDEPLGATIFCFLGLFFLFFSWVTCWVSWVTCWVSSLTPREIVSF